MLRRLIGVTISLVVLSSVLGATVFREDIAHAAGGMVSVFVTNDTSHPVPVREQATDANGNLKVHEQGIAEVNVTNGSLSVAPALPITGGGNVTTIDAGTDGTFTPPATASAVTMFLTGEVDSVMFFYQNSVVAVFPGPSGTTGTSPSGTISIPLARAIEFDTISCFANGNPGFCKIGWIGNSP
jgi:hypothetical protein